MVQGIFHAVGNRNSGSHPKSAETPPDSDREVAIEEDTEFMVMLAKADHRRAAKEIGTAGCDLIADNDHSVK